MGGAIQLGLKIVIGGLASAIAILCVGGAVKKVAEDSGDECLKAGLQAAKGFVEVTATAVASSPKLLK